MDVVSLSGLRVRTDYVCSDIFKRRLRTRHRRRGLDRGEPSRMGLHAYLVKKTHIRILPLVGVTLLLWVSATLNAENRDAGAAAHNTGCQSQGKPDQPTNQTSCIVDLKPGDVRLFAPSVSPAGKLHRWLDLQAASVATQYVFARGVTAANKQQYQVAVRGRFKLDAMGRVGINAGL